MNIWRVFVLAAIGLPAAIAAEGWQPSGPWGGSATAIAVDPNSPDELLAGSRNSVIFHSSNAGQQWTRLPFPRYFLGTISTLAIHPSDSNLYLAGVSLERSPYAGVWFSEDRGAHWNQAEGVAGISVEALSFWAKDPTRIVAGTRDGVWLSQNSGRSWTRISAPYNHELRGVTAIAIDPLDSSVIYAGTTHLPWKTIDGGKTWASIHDGMLDDSDVFSILIDPAKPAHVYASACSGIYHSDNAGEAWTKYKGIPATQRRTHVIRLHPHKRDVIYAGTTLGLLKSVNGGATFKTLNNLHVMAMVFDPRRPETLYLAAEGSGLWKSEDGGETLKPIVEGFVSRRVISVTSAEDELYLNVVQDGVAGGIFASSDGGSAWRLAASGTALKDNHITQLAGCPENPRLIFAGNETKVLRSKDAGKTWSELGFGIKGGARLSAITCSRAEGSGKTQILAGTDRGLLKSLDLGVTWQTVKLTSVNIQHKVQAIYTTPQAPNRLAVRTTQAIFVSEDSAASWRVLNVLFPVSTVNDLAITGGPVSAYLLATSQGLYASEDNGRTWQRRENGLTPGTVNTLAVRPGRSGEVFAAQFGNLFRSLDAGRNWTLQPSAELVEATVRRLVFQVSNPNRLLALTPDLGVFYLDVSEDRLHND